MHCTVEQYCYIDHQKKKIPRNLHSESKFNFLITWIFKPYFSLMINFANKRLKVLKKTPLR